MLAAAQSRGRGDVPGTGVPVLVKRAAAPLHVPVEVQEVRSLRMPLVDAMGRSRRAAPGESVETAGIIGELRLIDIPVALTLGKQDCRGGGRQRSERNAFRIVLREVSNSNGGGRVRRVLHNAVVGIIRAGLVSVGIIRLGRKADVVRAVRAKVDAGTLREGIDQFGPDDTIVAGAGAGLVGPAVLLVTILRILYFCKAKLLQVALTGSASGVLADLLKEGK